MGEVFEDVQIKVCEYLGVLVRVDEGLSFVIPIFMWWDEIDKGLGAKCVVIMAQ